jgi:hypothetical protein
MRTLLLAVCLTGSAAAIAAEPSTPAQPSKNATLPELQSMVGRFAPVELAPDLSKLPARERQVVLKLIQASQLMQSLFFRQVWAGNEALLVDLTKDTSPLGRARLQAFVLNAGPWDRVKDETGFIASAPPKPPQGNFYPMDVTRADLETWFKSLSEAERTKATGFFTTIRRTADGKLTSVPYSLEYQGELQLAASYLREAAALTENASLKKFLTLRADAFASNDYYASDVAWMELDAPVEPTIGPYEVYEDTWFNHKAAFEAYVTLRDDAETQKLSRLSAALQDIENNLPIDPALRNPKLGAMAPIRVVNSLYSAGDGNRGVQTAAFNLPNDERVTKEKGAKRVMLKNVQEAKFKQVLLPIAKIALSKEDQKRISFDAFFTMILMHELMHGLGPHELKVDGRLTTVRQALQETSSAIEEAKADVSGMWALQTLVDKGQLDKSLESTMYATMLASAFRSIRFGVNEAHGRGMALQLNRYLDDGAVKVAKDGTFTALAPKMRESVQALTRDLMTLQASGDRAKAQALLAKMGVIRPEVQTVLDRLNKVPTDIAPRFTTAEKLLSEAGAPRPASN